MLIGFLCTVTDAWQSRTSCNDGTNTRLYSIPSRKEIKVCTL